MHYSVTSLALVYQLVGFCSPVFTEKSQSENPNQTNRAYRFLDNYLHKKNQA